MKAIDERKDLQELEGQKGLEITKGGGTEKLSLHYSIRILPVTLSLFKVSPKTYLIISL